MILVQRAFYVAREDRREFERQSSEGLWPAFLHFGAQMVAFGSWSFGASTEPVVTHTVYADFDHWAATRTTGSYYADEAMLAETAELRPVFAKRGALIDGSEATPFELFEAGARPRPVVRQAGEPLAEAPPTFGRGSVVSERRIRLREGAQDEFLRLSADVIWPWLESEGGRGIAIGQSLMGPSNEVTTWFAFPTLEDWYRCAKPATANAPREVADGYRQRQSLIEEQHGRMLAIGTEWGARA